MRQLVLLGGPVGVGKSSVMDALKNAMPKLALLDADHVWRVSEDIVTQQNRGLAHANVNAVLAGYSRAGVDVCIVNWVFARSELYQPVIDHARSYAENIEQIYLVAEPEVIADRIKRRHAREGASYDVDELIKYSMTRLELIRQLPYHKIDTSRLEPQQVAEAIISYLAGSA